MISSMCVSSKLPSARRSRTWPITRTPFRQQRQMEHSLLTCALSDRTANWNWMCKAPCGSRCKAAPDTDTPPAAVPQAAGRTPLFQAHRVCHPVGAIGVHRSLSRKGTSACSAKVLALQSAPSLPKTVCDAGRKYCSWNGVPLVSEGGLT